MIYSPVFTLDGVKYHPMFFFSMNFIPLLCLLNYNNYYTFINS